ncbi:MAG TPA: lysine--tRNA ligase [Planctomycetaceae bacterium]|nr:lysine--tRNA ligase [Planctomycetaceae bacterium]
MAKEESAGTGVALEASRRGKMRKIEELGFDPWGQRFDNHLSLGTIRARGEEIRVCDEAGNAVPVPTFIEWVAKVHPELVGQITPETPQEQIDRAVLKEYHALCETQTGPKVRAAGRIILQRKKGKLIFLDIRDWSGRIQILIGANQVGETNWELAQCFDLGDIVGVDGELRKTKTGELSIFAEQLHFLCKSIETPPAKFHGLTDPELRSRLRYMDLVHTDGVLERMLNRTKIVHSVRNTLACEGFVEVEGPTLHTIAGGAAARPFTTHHNALDIPLVLRIALELHLKRLLVGGIERVYELGRVYRNEGIDQTHNPEFTMLEVYQAYGDYRSMMDLTEKIITGAIKAIHVGCGVEQGDVEQGGVGKESPFVIPWGGKTIDFTPPFARKTYAELFREHTGIDPADDEAVVRYAESIGLETGGDNAGNNAGKTGGKDLDVLRNDIFEAKVEASLIGPVFVMDYPASICPLTKRKRNDPAIAERFELFVHGMELANAYTELNDPDLQETLFNRQLEGQKAEESMARMDHDFIRALRHGMPPAGGLGIGIDRLAMILTDTPSIREVILFPLQRPEPGATGTPELPGMRQT